MKLVQRRCYDQRIIFMVIEQLVNGKQVDEKYKDHLLSGDYGGAYVTPDWLLFVSVLRERDSPAAVQNRSPQQFILNERRSSIDCCASLL